MDVNMCRLKSLIWRDSEGKFMYGFVLAARGFTHQFYTENALEAKRWVNVLKPFVILLDLRE